MGQHHFLERFREILGDMGISQPGRTGLKRHQPHLIAVIQFRAAVQNLLVDRDAQFGIVVHGQLPVLAAHGEQLEKFFRSVDGRGQVEVFVADASYIDIAACAILWDIAFTAPKG